jgi:hypothetical protein
MVPTVVAAFPKEILRGPRSWCEDHYDITHWTTMERGGHFAAFEQPEAFVEDIGKFFGTLQQGEFEEKREQTMSGTGILAVWNDRAKESEANYEKWYQTEHLPERLAVPGFIRGRRYQAVIGDLEFFTWYEVASPATLRSAAYKKCLANPTPWTQEMMSGVFVNANRTICRREVLAGEVFGSAALAIRFTDAVDPAEALATIEGFNDPTSLARAELWTSDEASGEGPMAEEAIRGPDAKIGSCLLLEFLRDPDAMAARDHLASRFSEGNVGVYRLLCERS